MGASEKATMLAIFRMPCYGAGYWGAEAWTEKPLARPLFNIDALFNLVRRQKCVDSDKIDAQPIEKSGSATELAREFSASGFGICRLDSDFC